MYYCYGFMITELIVFTDFLSSRYERQFGQIRCTRPSYSTEDSLPVSGPGQFEREFNTSPNHKQEHQNTS